MVRFRWSGVLVALIIVLAGCGTATSRVEALDEAVADVEVGDRPVTEADLDVFLETAEVRDDARMTVERLPVGTLREGEPLWTYVWLRSERETSIASLPWFSGTGQREGGGAELGVTGICGLGWTADGRPRDRDPCQAASPVTEIAAGHPLAIALYLYPATESGPVTAGRYRVSVPLDEKRGVSLELGYILVESGEVELPPWSGRTVRVRYAFDLYPGDAWRRLRVRIEDGYGRVFEELDMADLADRRNSERRGVFAVELPQSEPLHILLLRREGEAWVPCRRVWDLATEEDEEQRGPTVLMFDDCVPR